MTDEVAVSSLRKSLAKEIYEALRELEKRGWRIKPAGHGYRMLCPCGPGGVFFPVPSTPSNPGSVARRIRRIAEHCPDAHDLVQ